MGIVRNASSILHEMQAHRAGVYPGKGPPVSRHDLVRHWLIYANEYLAASEFLRTNEVPTFRPWFQVTGHAVECAVKSYLCAVRGEWPAHHNIVCLLDLALSFGLRIDEHDLARLVYIHHQYYEDLDTDSRYKSRFPTEQWEMNHGTMPDQDALRRIVKDILSQANSINEAQNRGTSGEDS